MDALHQKPGLDPNFRKKILNLIFKTLKENHNNAEDPVDLSKLYEVARKFEEKMYSVSTNKNDYKAKILQKLNLYLTSRGKIVDAPPAPMGVIQRQADEPQVLQKPLPVSLPTMQPRSIQPSSNQLMQDHQNGHQSVISSVQQHWPMKEQCSLSVTESCQQASQLMSPSLISQEQRDQIQDSRLRWAHMPSTCPQYQAVIGEDKYCLRSPTMQPRSTSILPSSDQLMQDRQIGHQTVSSFLQQHWPMKEQHSVSISESCQQPSRLLSPSIIPREQRDRIQDVRLQGTPMPSTSLRCRTLVGEDRHSLQTPTMQPRSISIQSYSNQLMQDHQTGNQSVTSPVRHHWPMEEQCSMPISKRCQQPSQLLSSQVISKEQRDQVQDARLQGTHMASTSLRCQTLVGEDKHSPQTTSMQPRSISIQPYSNQLMQDHQTGYQSVVSSEQQHRSMNNQRSMSITESCQQPSQLLSPSVISQEQRVRIQDARLQGTHMPSTSLPCRTVGGEGKRSPQSPMIRNSPSSASGSLPDADWKLLISQFQAARSRYLPQLIRLQKMAEVQSRKAKDERTTQVADYLRKLMKFFTAPESKLMTDLSKGSFCQHLNKAINCCNGLNKKFNIAFENRKPQSSDGQICLNNEPTTPTVNTSLIRNAMISQPSAQNFSSCSDVHATKQVDTKLLPHQGPEGTVGQYTHLNVEKDPRLSQSSSEKPPKKSLQSRKRKQLPADPMNSLFPSMAKLPKRFSTKKVQTKNTSCALKPSTKTEPKDTVSDHLPLTPMTPASAPKETVSDHLPSTSITPSSAPKETVSDHLPSTPITASSAPKEAVSDHLPLTPRTPSSAPEGIVNISKQPLERLTQVIQSMSKEALKSSIDSIVSAMEAVDKLPNCANYSISKFSHRNIERNIVSVGGYASTMDNCGSCAKQSRNQIDHSLMDEIREINQRLIETVIEVDCHSDSDSHNGTIIKCTYKPVSLSENLKRHFAAMTSLTTLSVKFLVPSNYPDFPPRILGQVPVECCTEIQDLMEKVKSKFECRAQSLVSVRELAQAWDDSARSVVSEVAVCLGGETFSSKYGTWECVPVA